MFGGSWRLGRFFGIEVRIDRSWVLIALLVTYTMQQRLAFRFLELSPGGSVVLALAFGLLLFSSVLAHEMAHAVVARRRGIEVKGITLFLFGGATHAKVDSRRPQDELIVSLVGPLTSLILGGIFLLLASPLGSPLETLGWVIGYLGVVNIVLAVFNMLPGFPLDGGRVLRALVWRATDSLERATRVASIAGQIVGGLLIAGGIAWLVTGEPIGAIWFASIGWFLAQSARASGRDTLRRRSREDHQPEDLEDEPSEPDLTRRGD